MNAATYNEEKKVWEATVAAAEWYSVQEIGQILGVGGPTVYSAVKRGSLVAYKVGGTTKAKHDDLLNYIARRKSATIATATADATIAKIIPVVESQNRAKHLATTIAAETGESGPAPAPIKLDLFQDDAPATPADPAA